MKRIYIFLALIVVFNIILSAFILKSSPTIVGTFVGKSEEMNYLLRISKDSSINFIENSFNNTGYFEYYGEIHKINNTVFHISCHPIISQGIMKGFYKDTLYFAMDEAASADIDTITVSYKNGTSKKIINDKVSGETNRILQMPINRRLFNSLMGRNYVIVTTNQKSLLTGKIVSLKVGFGSSVDFRKIKEFEFNVVMRNDSLFTVGQPSSYLSHFKLVKQTR